MTLDELIGAIATQKKEYDSILRLIQSISKLDRDREKNLFQIKGQLKKLEVAVSKTGANFLQREPYLAWLDNYRKDVQLAEEALKRSFGSELSKSLAQKGYKLEGQYPELKAGLFTIEIDFNKDSVIIWFGPRQEKLTKCKISIPEIGQRLQECKEQLGSELEPAAFTEHLYDAYKRLEGGRKQVSVPITAVLPELAFLIQRPNFQQDPRKEYFRSYSRADFSFDLYRIRLMRGDKKPLFEKKPHLHSASLSSTGSRKGFLWVPSDETGNGSYFSQLSFIEEAK